jgi:hypothetical protein
MNFCKWLVYVVFPYRLRQNRTTSHFTRSQCTEDEGVNLFFFAEGAITDSREVDSLL